MRLITNWKQLQALEILIDELLKKELESYFIEFVSELPDEEDYLTHDIEYFAIIGVFEASDDINDLQKFGMTTNTTTLLECIPEFVDEVFIGDEKYYTIIIILSADVGRVIYISNRFVTNEFRTWIDTWKEV